MNAPEYVLFWTTVLLYAAGTVTALVALVFRRERFSIAAVAICGAGLAAHVATLAVRIVRTGHLPVANRYENILAGSAVVMLFALVMMLRRPGLRPLIAFLAPFALLMLGYGLLNQPRFSTKSLVLDNPWMLVHILFAWLAYGAYTVAAGLGGLHLLRTRKAWAGKPDSDLPGPVARIPRAELLDDLIFRLICLGFLGHVVMIISGSIWARDLWGSYWSWDPVETWSLLSLLLYGLWIHLRLTLRWKGRRMAWLAILALLTVLVAFWGTSLFGTTSHSLDDLRRALPGEGMP